jgi:outer membrane protein
MSHKLTPVFIALLVIAAALPVAAQTKVAVIDVQRVVTESDPGKEALAGLKKIQDQKLEEGRAIQQELDSLRDQLTKQRLTLSDEKLEELNKQIEDRSIALRRFQDDAQRALEDARRKALDKLEARIMPIIETIGQEQGMTLIFNKFQSGLVYADETVDITDDVIRRFNTVQ